MKLLVVSWGDFERWKETKYRFGEETSVGPSTLPILQKVIRPDWTVIILSDTLGKDFSSLDALREDVRSRALDFLDRIGAGRGVDVIIAPGIGQFAHGTFRGNAMDAYYYLLHSLAQIVSPNENLEVHFDSTHGLNYITLLAYRALKDLLGIATITNEVKFTAYNSDPYVPGITRELTINVIESGTVKPLPLSEHFPGFDLYLVPYFIEKKTLKNLRASIKAFNFLTEEKRKLEAWVGSVVFGLPLLFVENFPEIEPIEEMVNELLGTWEEYVDVSNKAVTRKLAFGGGFGVLVKLLYQVKVLKKLRLKDTPSIDDLYTLSEMLFRGSIGERIKVELHRIEATAKKYASAKCFPNWMVLRDFLGFTSANNEIVPRNFLAHAGLEANTTEVRIEEWDVKDAERETRLHTFLRYSQDTKRRVENMAVKALKGG